MSDALTGALLAAIPLAPLLACLTTLAAGAVGNRGPAYSNSRAAGARPAAVAAALSLGAAVLLLPNVTGGGVAPDEPLVLYRWVTLADGFPEIAVGLQADPVSLLLAAAASLAMLVIVLSAGGAMSAEAAGPRFFIWTSLLHFATVMLLLAADSVQLFFFWQLSAVAFGLLIGLDTGSRSAGVAAGRTFLTQRAGEAALLIGIFLLFRQSGTFDLSAARTLANIGDAAGDRMPASLSWCCVLLIVAAAVRCRQFPLLLGNDVGTDEWLGSQPASRRRKRLASRRRKQLASRRRKPAGGNPEADASGSPPEADASGSPSARPRAFLRPQLRVHPQPPLGAIQWSLFAPAGIYALIRIGPVIQWSETARAVALAVGGTTALAAAASAAAQWDARRALDDVSSSLYGFLLLAVGIGSYETLLAAVFLLTVQQLVAPSLFVAAECTRWEGRGAKREGGGGRREEGRRTIENVGPPSSIVPPPSSIFSGPPNTSVPTRSVRWFFAAGAAVLASGMWGQLAVLESAWRAATGSLAAALAYWSGTGALLMLAFALFRLVFLSAPDGAPATSAGGRERTRDGQREEWKERGSERGRGSKIDDREVKIEDRRSMPPPPSPLLHPPLSLILSLPLSLVLLAALPGGPLGWFDRFVGTDSFGVGGSATARPFTVSFGLLPVLLGIVAAWMLYGQPQKGESQEGSGKSRASSKSRSSLAALHSQLLRPASAVAGHRYYLHDLWYLGLALPVRAVAQLCRFVDWFLLDALFVEVPRRALALAVRAARPLQNGAVQLYAVSVVLAAGLLLVVLLLLRG